MTTGFEKDLFSKEDYDLICLAGGYKFNVFGGKCFVLEGHRGIRKYDGGEMIFKINKGAVRVTGRDMSISQMTKNFVVVTGQINNCEVQND